MRGISKKQIAGARKVLEKDVTRDIFEFLEKGNYFFWRSNNIPVYAKNNAGKYMFRSLPKHTPKGLPDIMVVVNGKLIAIEVKSPTGKMRKEQIEFGTSLVLEGGVYIVARSIEDLKEVKEFMPPEYARA